LVKKQASSKLQFSEAQRKFPTEFQKTPTNFRQDIMAAQNFNSVPKVPQIGVLAPNFAFLDNCLRQKDFPTAFRQPKI